MLSNLVSGYFDFAEIQAMEKAVAEYHKYQEATLSPVEEAYIESIKNIEKKAKVKVKEK